MDLDKLMFNETWFKKIWPESLVIIIIGYTVFILELTVPESMLLNLK